MIQIIGKPEGDDQVRDTSKQIRGFQLPTAVAAG
jgi:hypothetical protein